MSAEVNLHERNECPMTAKAHRQELSCDCRTSEQSTNINSDDVLIETIINRSNSALSLSVPVQQICITVFTLIPYHMQIKTITNNSNNWTPTSITEITLYN